MMRNLLCSSVSLFLMFLGPWVTLAVPYQWGKDGVCLRCPTGQEPSTPCSEVEGPDVQVVCHPCPPGTFSDAVDPQQCRLHMNCNTLNRWVVTTATPHSNAVCGACLPGFHPASIQSVSTLHACVRTPLRRQRRNTGKSAPHSLGVGSGNGTNLRVPEEKSPDYVVFVLVPVFCVMGFLGILICNLLKKKGFHCTHDKETGEEEAAMPQKEGTPVPYIVDDPNEDTISVLVRLITEKKENAAALEQMLLEHEKKQMPINKPTPIKVPMFPHLSQFRSLPRLCTHQRHLHTINGLASRSGLCCSRCSQKKWPELLLSPLPLSVDTFSTSCASVKPPTPGLVSVLTTGRFEVIRIPESELASEPTTPTDSSDADSVDTTNTEPVDER